MKSSFGYASFLICANICAHMYVQIKSNAFKNKYIFSTSLSKEKAKH